MHITVQPLVLELENPFTLSYGTTTTRENILVQINDDSYIGTGEAAVVPYYGETTARVSDYLTSPAVQAALDEHHPWLEDTLNALPPSESSAARAALDMALHDMWGQRLGHPLYQLWGLNPARCPLSSFTVAMAEDDAAYREQLRAAQDFPLIKLKLGGENWRADLERVEFARAEIGETCRFCVDANGGWSADDTLAILPRLTAIDVLFVEQPVARDDFDGWRALRDALHATPLTERPPLIADESVQGVDSVHVLAGLVDGINIKLAKCGGLRPARQMITFARAYGLQILIGCMVESSHAVTAAAHLAPLVDYADLDGNLLITNDPYQGVQMEAGQLTLPGWAGLGLAPAKRSGRFPARRAR